ncbi:helix-turn-helix transcriptional regulator [Micromonospora sp. WMMD1082]|nr:helix-turn-helix transcriptional regulator [Micromonospora sp. WMMD1082]MDG4793592.1 helix-turn-helix transcriptional regulator [Micromonospora sp. WMMD1082]
MSLLRRVIGAVLRRERQRQGRTLREVAHAAGVSVPYLSEVERGRKEASSEVLAAICRALGLYLSDLLEEVRDELRRVERRLPAAPQGGRVPGTRHGAPAVTPAGRGTDGSAHPVARLHGVGFGTGSGVTGRRGGHGLTGNGLAGDRLAGYLVTGGGPGSAGPASGGLGSAGWAGGFAAFEISGSLTSSGIRAVGWTDSTVPLDAIARGSLLRGPSLGRRSGDPARRVRRRMRSARRARVLTRSRPGGPSGHGPRSGPRPLGRVVAFVRTVTHSAHAR